MLIQAQMSSRLNLKLDDAWVIPLGRCGGAELLRSAALNLVPCNGTVMSSAAATPVTDRGAGTIIDDEGCVLERVAASTARYRLFSKRIYSLAQMRLVS